MMVYVSSIILKTKNPSNNNNKNNHAYLGKAGDCMVKVKTSRLISHVEFKLALMTNISSHQCQLMTTTNQCQCPPKIIIDYFFEPNA